MKKKLLAYAMVLCLMVSCLLLSGCGLEWLFATKKPLEVDTISLDKTEENCTTAQMSVEKKVFNKDDLPEDYTGSVPLSYFIATSNAELIDDSSPESVDELKEYLSNIKLVIIIECENNETAKNAFKDLLNYIKTTGKATKEMQFLTAFNEMESLLSLLLNTQVVDNYYVIYTTSAYDLIVA